MRVMFLTGLECSNMWTNFIWVCESMIHASIICFVQRWNLKVRFRIFAPHVMEQPTHTHLWTQVIWRNKDICKTLRKSKGDERSGSKSGLMTVTIRGSTWKKTSIMIKKGKGHQTPCLKQQSSWDKKSLLLLELHWGPKAGQWACGFGIMKGPVKEPARREPT